MKAETSVKEELCETVGGYEKAYDSSEQTLIIKLSG